MTEEETAATQEKQGSGAGRRRLKCSICKQLFTRLEHLTRHERSHRNERPFGCPYCSVRFTRKDLIKTHTRRHHKDMLESGQQSNQTGTQSSSAILPPSTTSASAIDPSLVAVLNEPSLQTPMANLEGANGSLIQPSNSHASFSQNPMMTGIEMHDNWYDEWTASTLLGAPHSSIDFDGFLSEMESSQIIHFPQGSSPHSQNFTAHGTSQIDGHTAQSPSIVHPSFASDPMQNASLALTPPPSLPSKSPLEITQAKRAEISLEMMKARPDTNIRFPSCLAFEAYFTTFFDLVLPNFPCIHTPTWNAEEAHPCLLLSMASLGAALCGKSAISLALYHAARISTLDYIESHNSDSTDQPAWVIQSLFLCMSFGTWSANLALAREALACQSLLARLVGYVKSPEDSWAMHKEDPNLSWEEWVATETMIRTKLVVYVYFGNLNLACNIPFVLLNSEVNISLPSNEAEWLAPHAEAWRQSRKDVETSLTFSDALEGLMSPDPGQTVRCSTFGSLVMLHAILQQLWHIRQQNPSRNSLAQIMSYECALQKWKLAWESNTESSLSSGNPYYWLALSCHVLLASTYTRLYTVIGRIRLSTIIHDADIVAGVLSASVKDIPRSPGSVNAASHAIQSLLLPIRLGSIWRNRSDTGACSFHPYSFLSMQLCIFMSRWLEMLQLTDRSRWTPEELHIVALAEALIDEASLGVTSPEKKLHIRLLYAWADLFQGSREWGIVSVLREAMIRCGNIM